MFVILIVVMVLQGISMSKFIKLYTLCAVNVSYTSELFLNFHFG